MTPAPRRLAFSTLALAAVLAAGCSGGADSPPSPKIDACALFTGDDARTIAGEPVGSMLSTFDEARGRDPGECIYNSGTIDQPRILSLLIRYHRSPEAAQRVLQSSESALRSMTGGKVSDVPELGDGAFWVGGKIQQLHVFAGDRQLIITVQSPDGTDQKARARQIADTALARMETHRM